MNDEAIHQTSPVNEREYHASLALRNCRYLGARYAAKLLKKFGSAAEAVANAQDWKALNIPERVISEITSGRWKKDAEEEWRECLKSRASVLLWNDPRYPEQLRELADAPIFLYYCGNPDLLKFPGIAMVGSRQAGEESLRIAWKLARDLSHVGLTIISGMAMGIDAAAHAGALQGMGKSIGALGAGINVAYPYSNRQLYADMRVNGLLLSEFPPYSPPVAKHFPIRNRIISGLSLGVIVVEAAERSGSLITARMALEQNREVFAVPGRAFSRNSMGCQNLIRAGAHPVFSVEDVLFQLQSFLDGKNVKALLEKKPIAATHYESPAQKKPEKSASPENADGSVVQDLLIEDDSERIMACLRGNGKMHTDKIAQSLNLELEKLAPLLVALEMMGQITRFPGGFYEIV